MNKILYCSIACCLMFSAAIAQETNQGDKIQVDAIFVESQAAESQAVKSQTAELQAVLTEDATAESPALPHRAISVQPTNVQLASNCSSCHANAALMMGGSSLPNYVGVTSANMSSGAVLLTPDAVTRTMLKLEEDKGVVVQGVCPKCKRLASVLKDHDIILRVNGESADSPKQVHKALKTAKQLKLVVLRDGSEREIVEPVTTYRRTETKQKRYLIGVVLGELSPVVKSQLKLDESVNVFVHKFSKDSVAEKAGLKANDIILKVNDSPVIAGETLQKAVQNCDGKALQIEVLRDGSEVEVSVTPDLVEASSFIAMVEGQSKPTVLGVYNIATPNGPHVMPIEPAVTGFSWPPAVARQNQSLKKQLQKIEKQLEHINSVLEKLSDNE